MDHLIEALGNPLPDHALPARRNFTDALSCKPGNGKGRSVGELFAHTLNVRLMWLKSAAPELLAGFAQIERGVGERSRFARDEPERFIGRDITTA